jgi:diguanylate cyclase (GGDEF)-like protein/PAS domain S-box-containing protein
MVTLLMLLAWTALVVVKAQAAPEPTSVITAAVLKDFPPLYTRDKADMPAGFAIDVLERVVAHSGLSIRYIAVENWAEAMQAVRDGVADLVPGIGISPVRREEFLFTEVIETIPVSCFVRGSNQAIRGIESLPGRRVAVIGESAAETRLKSRWPGMELIPFPNIESALFQLMVGDVDAFVFPEPVLKRKMWQMNIGNDHVKVVGKPLMELKRGFLLRKTDQRLAERLNTAIRSYTRSKEYLGDYQKWYGKPTPFWTAGRYAGMMGLVLLVAIAGLLSWRHYTVTRLNRRLQESEAHMRTLIETLPDLVWLKDPDGVYLLCNRRFERFFGASEAQIQGKTDYDFVDQELADFFRQNDKFAMQRGRPSVNEEEVTYADDGHREVLETIKTPLIGPGGELIGVLGIARDITERKQQEAHILRQAHFDPLTDLPNRFLALDRLSQLIMEAGRNEERIAVLFLDLDDFKKINDTLGHESGDKLLVEAAERLRTTVRSSDSVGRLGGDEFIILLAGLKAPMDARLVVENMLSRFRNPFRIDARELVLTASVGIAVYPDDGDNPSELLRNADSAMYHAKDQGRNTYSYFTDAMNQEVSRRLHLEEQMHGALDRGEFRLCYQPQVDVASGRIVSVETLLRWHNPTLGEVLPTEFIPIAEQTGHIVPIGQFVMTTALVMCGEWQKRYGQRLSLAVNLSPRQFRDPDLVSAIAQAINVSGVDAGSLELEITEGVLMSGHAYIAEALTALNEMGVGIAMDDFGTGYSSLSYLRNYPFDTLKIDRDFINNITEDRADRELVNAAIAMAHSLGIKVVAEGVETAAQLALLTSLGCELVQGYLFSEPLAAEALAELLEAQRDTVFDYREVLA